MKKVYFLDIYEEHRSGFTTYKEELFACLNGYKQIRLHLLVENYPTDEFQIKEVNGMECFYIPRLTPIYYRKSILGTLLKQYIKNSSNSIFLINFSPTYQTALMLKEYFPSSKVIYVIHDFIWASFLLGDIDRFKRIVTGVETHEKKDIIYKTYEDNIKSFRLVDNIVCLSEDTFDLLSSFYHIEPSKLTIIHNGMRDRCECDKVLKKNSSSITLLAVGRVTRQKGMIDLIQSFEKVSNSFPNCHLVIAGKIEKGTLNALRKHLNDKIHILGDISHQELYEWYQKADIGIVPSYYEQCSYVGIEMKMFGLPIVASNSFGVKNMFNETNARMVAVEGKSSEEILCNISNSIIKILEMPVNQRKELARNSRKSYETMYHINHMKNNYVNLINQ